MIAKLKELKLEFVTIDVEADEADTIGFAFVVTKCVITFIDDKNFDVDIELFTGTKVRMALNETPISDFWKKGKTAAEYKNLLHPNRSEMNKNDVHDMAKEILAPYLSSGMIVVGTTLDVGHLYNISGLPFKGVSVIRSIAEFLSGSVDRPYAVINNNRWISEKVRKAINPVDYVYYNEIGEQVNMNSCHDCVYDAYINACNFITLSIIRVLCCK